MADEVWISVDIFGPQVEIDRFKEMCIISSLSEDGKEGVDEIAFSSIVPTREKPAFYGQFCDRYAWKHPWNFKSYAQSDPGSYEIRFDVASDFPTELFKCLADLFPLLSFHCDCIANMDEFMGFGWYNGPKGGEEFGFYDVPPDYWTKGGCKRNPLAEFLHQRRVAKLKCDAREVSKR